MADNKLEMVMSAKDEASAKIQTMGENYRQSLAKMKAANLEHTKSIKDAAQAHKIFDESVSKIKNTVSGALTPAMASLGIASFGVGSGLAKVVDLLRKAGESYNILNDAAKRGGVSVGYLTATTVAFERWGISAEKAREAVASVGEHLSKFQRGAPAERNAMIATFKDMIPFVNQVIAGTKTAEERTTALLKIMSEHPEIPIDKKRAFLEFYGVPAELASKSKEDIAKGLTAGADYAAKHPPDMALYGKLDETFARLRESLSGIGDDMVKAFGPNVVKGAEAIHDFFESPAGIKIVRTEFEAIGRSIRDTAEEIRTIAGWLERFNNWRTNYGSNIPPDASTKDAELFAKGLKPMAFHPGGGGGRGGMFGSEQYPALPDTAGGVQGGPLGKGGGGHVGGGQGGMIPDTAGAGTNAYLGKGSEFLKNQRASRIAEINANPALKENVLKMLQLEEGSVSGKTGAMETMLNRLAMTGGTVEGELHSGFYGPINRGHLRDALGARARASSQAALDAAAGGSNISQGRTDQGMAGDPNASGPGRIKIPGTSGIFNYWKGSRGGRQFSHADSAAFAADQQRHVLEGAKEHGAHLRDFVSRGRKPSDATLLKQRMRSVDAGDGTNHYLTVDFQGMPRGVKTSYKGDQGLFKEVKLQRGRQMATANQDS
jgi:hypothetical protein